MEGKVKGPGLKPPQRGIFKREVIGPTECPIMHRWTILSTRVGKLMVHRFLPNADDRAEHDHPASFVTLVLGGGYDDQVPCPACNGTMMVEDPALVGKVERGLDWMPCERCVDPAVGPTGFVPGDRMRPGMIRFRPAEYRHRTRVGSKGCWTLVVMGPKRRDWGFWKDGLWWYWKDHERLFGFGMRCPEDPL